MKEAERNKAKHIEKVSLWNPQANWKCKSDFVCPRQLEGSFNMYTRIKCIRKKSLSIFGPKNLLSHGYPNRSLITSLQRPILENYITWRDCTGKKIGYRSNGFWRSWRRLIIFEVFTKLVARCRGFWKCNSNYDTTKAN